MKLTRTRRTQVVALIVLASLLMLLGMWQGLRAWPSLLGKSRNEVLDELFTRYAKKNEGKVLIEIHNVTKHLSSPHSLEVDPELQNSKIWRFRGNASWVYNALELTFGSNNIVVTQRPITEIRE